MAPPRARRTKQQLGAAALLLRQRIERRAAAADEPLPNAARHRLRGRTAGVGTTIAFQGQSIAFHTRHFSHHGGLSRRNHLDHFRCTIKLAIWHDGPPRTPHGQKIPPAQRWGLPLFLRRLAWAQVA